MKDNKLLAEYLGIPIDEFEHRGTIYLTPKKYTKNILYWEPNSDWNQLMMVIEKIRKELNDEYSPCRHYDLHDVLTMLVNSFIGKCDYTIKDIRNACIEYIKSKS